MPGRRRHRRAPARPLLAGRRTAVCHRWLTGGRPGRHQLAGGDPARSRQRLTRAAACPTPRSGQGWPRTQRWAVSSVLGRRRAWNVRGLRSPEPTASASCPPSRSSCSEVRVATLSTFALGSHRGVVAPRHLPPAGVCGVLGGLVTLTGERRIPSAASGRPATAPAGMPVSVRRRIPRRPCSVRLGLTLRRSFAWER